MNTIEELAEKYASKIMQKSTIENRSIIVPTSASEAINIYIQNEKYKVIKEAFIEGFKYGYASKKNI